MHSTRLYSHLAIILTIATAAGSCGPAPSKPRELEWIRFDPVTLTVDKPMPTIWIAPNHIPTPGFPSHLIVLDRAKFPLVVHAATETCSSAKGPAPLDTTYQYYSIVKSVRGAEQHWCTLSQGETCVMARKFYELGLEPGLDKLADAFEPLLLRAGCVIARPKF